MKGNLVKIDLILCADWHLREDTPSCRTDNFWDAQWGKVAEISRLQNDHHCPVLHAGDLFHHWKPSPYLISQAIIYMPSQFYTVVGQHDLPQHNLDLIHKTGVETLITAGAINWIKGAGNFGQEVGQFQNFGMGHHGKNVGVWHHFVWDGKNIPWPGCDYMTARQVLKDNPEFDLIVTGDYHKPFTYEYKGRLLVNCGCLTRQAADYADHKPRVYLWNAKTNTVKPHYLKIKEGVVTREHLEIKEQRDKRMDAFISRLSTDWEVGVSFEENLRRFVSSNIVRKSVIDLVYKSMEV